MLEVPATPDVTTLLGSLQRNVPGAIYRCALDPSWTMELIGDEIERITAIRPPTSSGTAGAHTAR